MTTKQHTLGVIGGSGLYELDGLTDVVTLRPETPFGAPSDAIVSGRLGETALLFLPRHGLGHRIAPHQINYRANICALKMAGATHLVSVSAVGSMREAIEPGHLVTPDQFVDLTKRRASTFFEDGIVAHVGFADPVCHELQASLSEAAERAGGRVHRGGTYICIEGPQFSTRAESQLYRTWGASVIGMTAMPEAKLAREAELPFALLALATDYDCWHESEADVSVQAVLDVMRKNAHLARRTIVELASTLPDPAKSHATSALASAILTAPDRICASAQQKLSWLLDK